MKRPLRDSPDILQTGENEYLISHSIADLDCEWPEPAMVRAAIKKACVQYDETRLYEMIEKAKMMGKDYPWTNELADAEKFLYKIAA